jgi:hypothetical protein
VKGFHEIGLDKQTSGTRKPFGVWNIYIFSDVIIFLTGLRKNLASRRTCKVECVVSAC